MARTPEHEHAHVIEEIESIAERAAQWIRDHLALSIILLVAVLGTAAGVGGFFAHRTHQIEAASDAVDQVTSSYMEAMGADPSALVAPELANPAAAAEIRSEFATRFAAVAEEHAGTVPAALARLEQGNLIAAGGDSEAAIAIWQAAIDELGRNSNLRAIFEQRIGVAHDGEARWLEAAQAYERAGASKDYPLRYQALAEAARCYQQAGEIERARELALRIHAESPDAMLPQQLADLLAELRQAPAL